MDTVSPAGSPLLGGAPGPGPHVVLVHGVGIDGSLFAPVAERLRRSGRVTTVVGRRGYDHRPPTPDLDRHLDDLAATLAGAPPRSVVVAGVSGGATLGLGLALRGHPALAAVVIHESLLGPAAPEQHERIGASARLLADDPRDDAVEGFLRRLVTDPTWDRIDPGIRAAARARGATVRAEVPGFVAFAPTPAALARVCAEVPVVWTTGRHSPPWRREAADVAAAAGARVVVLDATHTPQVEDPDGFTAAVLAVTPSPSGPTDDPIVDGPIIDEPIATAGPSAGEAAPT